MSNFSSSVATQVTGRSLSMQQQLTALHQISVVLSRSLELEQTLGTMLQALHDHAQMQYGLVSLFDHDRSALFIQAMHGIDVTGGATQVDLIIGQPGADLGQQSGLQAARHQPWARPP